MGLNYYASIYSYLILAFNQTLMAIKIQLKPRKTAAQQRSAMMVETILQAATRVLEKESLAGFNTNRVAEVAGVSIGSVYQYFPNKEALMAALILRTQQTLAEGITQLIHQTQGKPLHEAIAALAKLAVQQQFGKPLLAAALDHEEKRLPVQKILANSETSLIQSVQILLNRHKKELPRKLPASAAQDCITLTKALTDSAAIGKHDSNDLEQRIIRTLMGYLNFDVR
jgi:AcrR family transcriptional regulator